MPKPNGTEWINTYVETAVKRELRVLAAQQDMSVAALVRSLIVEYVKKKGSK